MGLGNSITAIPGGQAFRYSANTAWADEFLHHHSQPGPDPRAMAVHPREGNGLHLPALGNRNGGQMHSDAGPQAWAFPDESLAIDPAQREMNLNMFARQNRPPGLGGVIPSVGQYTMYPADRITDDARLADTAEQAMEAAFAAYDQDFEVAMNGWMKADGQDDLDAHVQNIRMMEGLNLGEPLAGTPGLTTNGPGPSTQPMTPGFNNPARDQAMMRHASDIVATLSSNGSAETRAKMSGSSFQGLMKAIASGKAVVVDDNFIDTSTGEVIHDLVELSGVRSSEEESNGSGSGSGSGNGLQTMGGTQDGAADNTKGKGKMKSLEEQEQEHQQPPA